MKPRIFKLTLFLLAGAIINLAVAWGCALLTTTPLALHTEGRAGESDVVWIVQLRRATGTLHIHRFPYQLAGGDAVPFEIWQDYFARWDNVAQTNVGNSVPSWSLAREPAVMNATVLYPDEYGFGWPLLSAFCQANDSAYQNRTTFPRLVPSELRNGECLKGGFRFDQLAKRFGLAQDSVLPYFIIFPGFAINTIFYAAIVWMLFALPGAVRRRVRIKRGQCASCGYSLRGSGGVSDKCPECGATA